MKRLYPAVLVTLILAAHSVQAQTDPKPYLSSDDSVYTDIVGEFEPSDDWIVQPEKDATSFSKASTSKQIPPQVATGGLGNIEIFGKTPPPQQLSTLQQHVPPPQQISRWRGSSSGQLWESPAAGEDQSWHGGRLQLQVGIDYLYFSRGAAADNLFGFNNVGETFSLADIDPGNETAERYRLMIVDDGGTGFELVGYQFDEFNGSLTLEGEGITPVFFGGIPSEPAESYEATYRSELSNFEANVWHRTGPRLKIGFGMRYLKLEEEFDIEFIEDPNSTTATTGMGESGFFSTTENRIFGGQVMARLYRPIVTQVYLEGGVDAGYGTNRITVDSDTADIDTQTEDDTSTGFFSFSGGVAYRVLDGLTLRAGYEGLLLTSVALSPDQSDSINAFTGASEIQTGSLYFSGAYFGGTFRF